MTGDSVFDAMLHTALNKHYEDLLERGYEEHQLENSLVSLIAHPEGTCHGDVCPLHKMTQHSMRSFPQHWRGDRGLMESICPHGVGHPDPDDPKLLKDDGEGIHGCDGCCAERESSS